MQSCREYFRGKTLLITGATGFVGKALIEAILDRLTEVRRVYLLIRPRADEGGRPRSAQQTLHEDLLTSVAFDALRARHGRAGFETLATERLEAVDGDLASEGLGLAPGTRARLCDEVDLIINGAALAVFDAPLDQALEANTIGPLRVLDLAREARKAPFVVHVSTCYVSNVPGPVFETPLEPWRCPKDPTPESGYDADAEVAALGEIVRTIRCEASPSEPEQQRERLVAEGLARARHRGWHDTYTYTKAMGEQLFARHRGAVPGMIVRPSIIESALRRPAPGWIDGFRMTAPLIVGYGRGQIEDFPAHPETVLDLVPCDWVVNAILAAIPRAHLEGEPEMLQIATGMENPLLVGDFCEYLRAYFERSPPGWASNGKPSALTYPEVDTFLERLTHRRTLPLRAAQALLAPLAWTTALRRRRRQLRALLGQVERLSYMATLYGPYAQVRTQFLTYNLRALWTGLPPEDRERFPFASGGLDWKRYVQDVHVPGIARHLLRMDHATPTPLEPNDTDPVDSNANANANANAGVVGTRWRKAARVLAVTRDTAAEEGAGWMTPAHKKALQRTTRHVIRLIARHYLALRVNGLEHLPVRDPVILVANHASHVDTGLLLAALGPRATRVHPTAANDYWFRSPLTGSLLHGMFGAVPFDRKTHNMPRALRLPAQILRHGHSLIFYPEGSRSPDGSMRRFKSTVGLLALASGTPVLPACTTGSHQVLPKGARMLRRHPVSVRFGPVMRIEPYLRLLDHDYPAAVARRLAHDLEARVGALAQQEARASGG